MFCLGVKQRYFLLLGEEEEVPLKLETKRERKEVKTGLLSTIYDLQRGKWRRLV